MPSPASAATPPVLCLAGPTAAGKTAAALAIAAAFGPARPVEIVSVDSAVVYRGLDIGTAKPTAAERAAVPHHLVDVIDPRESWSAARFVAEADAAIAGIHARGAIPLLVGGTMLYFRAWFDGLDAMPPADPAVRAELAGRLARDGLEALHAELARLDPPTAARLAPGDTQRILRALEVAIATGRPLSSFHTAARSGSRREAPLISLEPLDRAALHGRIAARFDRMLADGLVDEVRALRARGDLHADLPSMRCVGYRQAWEAIERNDFRDLAERGAAATRQLAKRQTTWLRGMPDRHVVAADADDAIERTVRLARRLLETPARSLVGETRDAAEADRAGPSDRPPAPLAPAAIR